MELHFRFTSTYRDLVDASAALRESESGMRPWARALLALLGVMWVAGSVVMLSEAEALWQPVASVVIGALVLWNVVVQPLRERWRIKAENGAEAEVALTFAESGIHAVVNGAGTFQREWREVVQVVPSGKGILFCTSDGVNHWIPGRVFRDGAERQSLLELARAMRERSLRDAA